MFTKNPLRAESAGHRVEIMFLSRPFRRWGILCNGLRGPHSPCPFQPRLSYCGLSARRTGGTRGTPVPLRNRRDFHCHGNLVFAAAGDDTAQWTYVAVVATVGDGDVILGRQEIVRRVEIHPAEVGTVHREPGVRSVRAHEAFLTFHR